MATAALARASSSIIVVNARPFHPCTSGVRPFGLGLTAARFFVAQGPRHLANTTARQAAGVPQRPWPRSSAGARRFSLVARWMMHDLAEIGLARAPLPHRHTVCKAHTVALCLRTIPSTRPRGLCTGASVRRAPAQHAARSTMCPIQLPDSPNSNCAGPPANGIRWSRPRRALRKRVETRCLFFFRDAILDVRLDVVTWRSVGDRRCCARPGRGAASGIPSEQQSDLAQALRSVGVSNAITLRTIVFLFQLRPGQGHLNGGYRTLDDGPVWLTMPPNWGDPRNLSHIGRRKWVEPPYRYFA